MMFTFDAKLFASFTVDAPDKATAEAWLKRALDCASINAGALPNGDPILGEASLDGELDFAEDLEN